jgi:hypothetical protein
MLALLALAVGGLGLPRVAVAQTPTTDSYYVMDREAYSRTPDTRLVRTTYDLENGPNLAAFPMQIGDWVGQDLPITNLETFPTLDADNLVYRGYRRDSDGGMIIFSLVGGTKGQSFHHPLVCYDWAHWQTEDLGTTTVPVANDNVVLREVVGVDPDGPRQLDLSFYLWPDDSRDWSKGATQVRITGVAYDGDDKALGWVQDFARLLFADVQRPATLGPVGPTGTESPPAPQGTLAPSPDTAPANTGAAPADTGAAPGDTGAPPDTGPAPADSGTPDDSGAPPDEAPAAPAFIPAPADQPLIPLPG